MINITFIENNEKIQAKVQEGDTVLEAARNNNIALEGVCDGCLACSTCHVILDEVTYSKLSEPSEDEEDMLDLAPNITKTSRLGCQVIITEAMENAEITIPNNNRKLKND